MAFSQIPMYVMIQFSHNLACFEPKTPFFRQCFGQNILKIITSVPDAIVKKWPKMLPNTFFVKITTYGAFTVKKVAKLLALL
jgi:hypothetical protein